MSRLLLSEEERIEILDKHRKAIREQLVKEVGPPTDPEPKPKGTDMELLNAGIKGRCFGDSSKVKIVRYKGQLVVRKESTTKPDNLVLYYPNGTYVFYDNKTKQTTTPVPYKKPCKAMQDFGKVTDPTQNVNYEYDNLQTAAGGGWTTGEKLAAQGISPDDIRLSYDKKEFPGKPPLFRIKQGSTGGATQGTTETQKGWKQKLEDMGYDLNPTDVEKSELKSYPVEKVGVPEGVFPPGTQVWYNPNKRNKMQSTGLGNILDAQQPERDVCRREVENLFNAFKRRASFKAGDARMEKVKDYVQACKDTFYNKWGILGRGKKLDSMLDVLSGNAEGAPPSNSPFRLQ